MLLWLSLLVALPLPISFSALMMVIHNCLSPLIAHFMWVRLSENRTKFEVVQDFTFFREDNNYRYTRHASIRGSRVVFCSEQGKENNKIVAFELNESNGEIRLIGELQG